MKIPNNLKSVFQPRKSRLKSCNGKCTLDIPELKGLSYGYWGICRKINGLMVFNYYSYSNTTNRHQSQIKAWLNALGIAIDLGIEASRGLERYNWAENAISHDAYQIGKLQAQMKRGTKAKNIERQKKIEFYQGRISQIYWVNQSAENYEKLTVSQIRSILDNQKQSASFLFENERLRKLERNNKNESIS